MANFDKHIQELINNDQLGFEADPAIHQRLEYHMLLKSPYNKTSMNSIIPKFKVLGFGKQWIWKLAVVGMLIFFFIGYQQQIKQNPFTLVNFDSIEAGHIIDSNNYSPIYDSAFMQ